MRIARTCRRLGIATVGVHSDADEHALATRVVDEVIRIGPARVQDSYLNVDALIAALKFSGADAVHPGYGLLSEDARLSAAVTAAGATFVGPRPDALTLLGDKVRARELADAHGIHPPPGTMAPIDSDGAALDEARRIGFPVLVKAAAGGGGIGMQVAESEERLETALATCRARSAAAFGDDRVYLERYLVAPRHIEVQVAADAMGCAEALGDRECSVQRRHQKVVEEAPAPSSGLPEVLRAEIYPQAERLIAAAGLVGVATVEFIAEAGHIYFLEVNARLQVEHPVTELLTGLDLVELQLRLAQGQPLDDCLSAPRAAVASHAVEARVYAEDPAKGFIPQPGRIEQFTWEEQPWLRVDAGYEAGDTITHFYDPLIAKFITSGESRGAAVERLARALGSCQLSIAGPKGPRRTNLPLLVAVLQSSEFASETYDTHLIERVLTT